MNTLLIAFTFRVSLLKKIQIYALPLVINVTNIAQIFLSNKFVKLKVL